VTERAAIIGGGVTGLAAARELAGAGAAVTVFDKGRGFGGRLSTRRVEVGGETLRFNHGASAVHVSDGAFREAVADYVAEGAAVWRAEDRVAGAPFMSDLVAAMGDGLDVRFETAVSGVELGGGGWRLVDAEGHELGAFGRVVVAVPAPQAAELLETAAPAVAETARRVEFAPALVAMLGFEDEVGPEGEIEGDGGVIEKIVRTSGRAWTVHASEPWSRDQLERGKDEIGAELAAAAAAIDGAFVSPACVLGHRWRYGRAVGPVGERFLESGEGLMVCGDGFGGVDAESAWLSGMAAGRRAAGG